MDYDPQKAVLPEDCNALVFGKPEGALVVFNAATDSVLCATDDEYQALLSEMLSMGLFVFDVYEGVAFVQPQKEQNKNEP